MKKLLVFLCVVFLVFGVIGCKKSSTGTSSNSSFVASATTQPDDTTTSTGSNEVVGGDSPVASVPEPATILLLGSGLVGLAVIGRKKFFKKDQRQG